MGAESGGGVGMDEGRMPSVAGPLVSPASVCSEGHFLCYKEYIACSENSFKTE